VKEVHMRRRAGSVRRPTREDLTDVQRQILDVLPSDEFRELFLDQLPGIQPVSTSGKKKAEQIQRHAGMLEGAIRTLQAHKQQLEALARNLENGTGGAQVDLRKELAPPDIEGVVLRYVRGKRGG
jgi:hypothetical protein